MRFAEGDRLGFVLHSMHMRPHLSVLKVDESCYVGLILS